MTLALSILDQSTVASGRGPAEAIRETLALARLADGWGYRRYWLAEHHNSASHAGTAPEILIAAIAATTRRIRVGSAGVMLPHYSALKVAEQFRVLEAIAPGRIDLGVGRAPGSDGRTAYALNPNAAEAGDRVPQQVQELLGWLILLLLSLCACHLRHLKKNPSSSLLSSLPSPSHRGQCRQHVGRQPPR
jgi:luciferase family oxidoreductase group 1